MEINILNEMVKEVPFTVIRDGKVMYQSHPESQNTQKRPSKQVKPSLDSDFVSKVKKYFNIGWKSALATGIVVGGLTLNSMFKPFYHPTQMTEKQLTEIPDSTRNMMRDLAARNNLSSRHSLSVDDYLFDKTQEVFDTMSYEQIVKTANLNGLYKDFGGLKVGDHVDFEKGFAYMWNQKINRDKKKDGACDYEDYAKDLVNNYSQTWSRKSNLKKYSKSLENKIEEYKEAFNLDSMLLNPKGKPIHPEKIRLIKNFYDHLDADILISYNTTELFPDINPKLNLIIFEKLLQEAGLDFLYDGTPAQWDTLNSRGPSQLTPYVVNETAIGSLNPFLPDEYKIPTSMEDIKTRDDYDKVSFFNLVYNTKNLSGNLFKINTLTNFNNLFENLNNEEQDLLVTGILTAMNYRPHDVAKGVANYVDEAKAGRVTDEGIINGLWVGKAQNYYNKSVKNYLTLTHED